jgi:hypothetical protein
VLERTSELQGCIVKANGKLTIEPTDTELEQLRNIHNATALKEMTQHPGWGIYTGIVGDMVDRLEAQHLNFAIGASRDAYWISGVRLAAVRDFRKILIDMIVQKVDLLNQPLQPQNGPQPEGE